MHFTWLSSDSVFQVMKADYMRFFGNLGDRQTGSFSLCLGVKFDSE